MIVKCTPFTAMSMFGKFNYLIKKEFDNEIVNYIGFESNNLSGRRAEIIDLVGVSRPNEIKIYNIKVSWSEYEIPLVSEVDEVVNSLLSKLRLDKEKIIYGVHHDTDNLHIHVLVYLSTKCQKIKFNNDVHSVGVQIASKFGFWYGKHNHSQPAVRLPKELRTLLKEGNPEEVVKIIKKQEGNHLVLEW
ncbi:hypothetical protein HZU75_14610 [Chitinibacter fontanus]|uniref:MobA/VirD2-like nuclease domain-containing protein n=1 Tax=Chitinibacter fontanus TaxID=1737446 RepID=A0A7D5Z5Z1_9NEIS|nr:relaxase/mobilization nuclease domain-containing protein [Chitinibacter fontanus]QLI82661.1 hypothetical protein HZU75_14610 [Chitinibacter fontanus]